jgi:hypothetical protein
LTLEEISKEIPKILGMLKSPMLKSPGKFLKF